MANDVVCGRESEMQPMLTKLALMPETVQNRFANLALDEVRFFANVKRFSLVREILSPSTSGFKMCVKIKKRKIIHL